MRFLPTTKRSKRRFTALLILLATLLLSPAYFVWMPGASFAGELEPLTAKQLEAQGRMQRHVEVLATEITTRDTQHPESLEQAAEYIRKTWIEQGFEVHDQEYVADGVTVRNLEVVIRGLQLPDEIVIVGAHYDSAHAWPGADDNASGVAAMLELSLRFSLAAAPPSRTLRFVAFTNEEPPHFQTDTMGSLVYAKRCVKRGEQITGMLSLETVAYYSNEVGSQQYPWPLGYFYGDVGNFIAFVGDTSSRAFVHETLQVFRNEGKFPSDGIAAPTSIPGIGWSDHWSFSKCGFPAVMITDTAPFRNPHYHKPTDTAEKLDYESLTRVVQGVEQVVSALVRTE